LALFTGTLLLDRH